MLMSGKAPQKRQAPTWGVGEKVVLKMDNRREPAQVILATRNGRSLAVEFDGFLAGYLNRMCLLWHDGAYHDLIGDRVVTVRKTP